MPTASHAPSLTRKAATLLAVALAVVAVLPPLLWLVVGGAIEHTRARATAQAVGWLVEHGSAPRSPDDPRELLSHLDILPNEARLVLPEPQAASALRAPTGTPAWPTFTVDDAPGGVRVEYSLRALVEQVVWLALASCAAALAGWTFGLHRSLDLLARAEGRMRSQASLDPLTGLLNVAGLRRRMIRAHERQRRGGTMVGVLLVDLDRFGLINETLGQAAGDAMLRGVADRIRAVTRAGDGLARIAADRFAVHVDTSAGVPALTAMASNLLRAFEAPFLLDGRPVVAKFSIGVALSDAECGGVDELLHRAAEALRRAKKQGGNRCCVSDAASGPDTTPRRLDLEQRLHGALGAGQFAVVFQPIVDAQTGRAVACEALLRWNEPARGSVAPTEFIPLLEETGLIVPVGRWVLQQACRQAVRRLPGGDGRTPMAVSVNLSPVQLGEPDVLAMVDAVLRETGLPPERLQLEVTESLLVDPSPQTLFKLDELAARGVRLAVDDFGTGYSSLMYLKRFPLHVLKIDRAFVRDIAVHERDLTIVRAIIDLGHGLGMRVTAEGVETEAQRKALRALGCDNLQGFLLGRPAPGDAPAAAPAALPAGAAPQAV